MAKYADAIASALFVVFALVCTAASLRLPFGTVLEPLPGFVPLIVSLFMLGVALIQLGYSVLGKDKEIVELGEDWHQPAIVVAGLAVFSVVLVPLGYIIATAGLCLLILLTFDRQAWLKSIAISAAVAVLTYILFDRLLDVNLPDGILAPPLSMLFK